MEHSFIMTRRLISSGNPLENEVGYSRAIVQGNWCFVAGTTGPDPVTRIIPDDVANQVRNAFVIAEFALVQAGFTLADVVRATYYLTNADDVPRVNPLLGAVFGNIRPAATCVVVAALVDPALKFEVELTALRGDS
jgi:enamine deaminase RidA (YjgF/YER057c/UK114 family)